MKVLVTGAGGYVGRHVVQALCQRGHQVRAIDIRPLHVADLGWNGLAVDLVQGDLCGSGDVAVRGMDAVIHLAARMKGSDSQQVAGTVEPTLQLIKAMESAGVNRLVLASSVSVYDWQKAQGSLDEDSPLELRVERRDQYAMAKLRQEEVVRQAAQRNGWVLTILRPAIIWGAGMWDLPQLGPRAGSLRVVIGPSRRLPLTHVENCADAFAIAVNHPAAADQTLNVADGEGPTAWEYVTEMRRRGLLAGTAVPVPFGLGMLVARVYGFLGIRKGPKLLWPACFAARFKPLDVSGNRLRQRLGWRPLKTYTQRLEELDTKGNVALQA